jgi:hypothetical protein
MIDERIIADLNQTRKLQEDCRQDLYVLTHSAQLCPPHEIATGDQSDEIDPTPDNLEQHSDQTETSREDEEINVIFSKQERRCEESSPPNTFNTGATPSVRMLI